MAEAGAPPLYGLDVEDARAVTSEIRQMIGPGPEVASVADIAIPGRGGEIPARVYEPVADPPATVVFYHGGGWVIGSVADWDPVCRALAAGSGCRVVSVDYRLAHEHTFPPSAADRYDAPVCAAEYRAAGRPLAPASVRAGGNLARAPPR